MAILRRKLQLAKTKKTEILATVVLCGGLVKDFKEYILTGGDTNGNNGYGGLYCLHWGYTIDGMDKIVSFAKEIGFLNKDSLSYKDYLLKLYNNESWMLTSNLKEKIEKELIAN